MLDLLKQITLDQYVLIAVALFTSLAALGALKSASATKKAAHAQLFRSHFEVYASEKMKNALQELKEVRKHPNWQELIKKYPIGDSTFIKELNKKPISALVNTEDNSDARRYVKYYFTSALRLRKLKFMDKKLFKNLGEVAGVDLLYDVVMPLEEDPRAKKHIKEIETICGRYNKEGEKG